MTLGRVCEILEAELLSGSELMSSEVTDACGSDLMSDVLAYVKEQSILLTGLVNPQVIRTAEMMDMHCVIFVRGKMPGSSILELAASSGIAVMSTKLRMYEACGRLYTGGLKTE